MSLPTTFSWNLSLNEPTPVLPASAGTQGNRTSGNGKTGFAIPFGADGRGRVALTSGPKQLKKLILLNLSDLDSANPFQGDIGLSADMVFAIASVKLKTDVLRRVNQLFRRLQLNDRARLSGTPTFDQDDANQEMTLNIVYIDLEENKPGDVGIKFSLEQST